MKPSGRPAGRAVVAAALISVLPSAVMVPTASAQALPTSLEALGPPSEKTVAKVGEGACATYAVVARKSHLKMGGMAFIHGFRVTTDPICDHPTWTWTWHIGGNYKRFSAYVGLPMGDTTPTTLTFVGPKAKLLAFSADGREVKQVTLVAGLPTRVTMNVGGLLNLSFETTTAGTAIGFGDDRLAR